MKLHRKSKRIGLKILYGMVCLYINEISCQQMGCYKHQVQIKVIFLNLLIDQGQGLLFTFYPDNQIQVQNYMLFVTFQLLDGRKQVKFPPFITTIDTNLLKRTVQQLKSLIHSHFKPYISPFITDKNLSLSCKSAESMINSMPLCMYIDYDQAMQYVKCSTQPKETSDDQKWKFTKNLFIYKGTKEAIMSVSQKNQKGIQEIFRRELSDNDGETLVIVNGQILEKKGNQKWTELVEEHWKQWALQNQCLYVRFFTNQAGI